MAQMSSEATVMSNLGLERALASHHAKLLRTAVGDRYVVEAMREGGFTFGGEQSGHIVFLREATTGDGLLAALQVLSVMVQEGPRSRRSSPRWKQRSAGRGGCWFAIRAPSRRRGS